MIITFGGLWGCVPASSRRSVSQGAAQETSHAVFCAAPWLTERLEEAICVHTTPDEFENAALFLRLGLPSTIIRHENGTFRKSSSNRRNVKTPAFRFRVDGKHFDNEAFRKRWCHDNDVISLTKFFVKHNSKMTGGCCVFKFLRLSVDGKHLMRFQSDTSVFKFLRRNVDREQRARQFRQFSVVNAQI